MNQNTLDHQLKNVVFFPEELRNSIESLPKATFYSTFDHASSLSSSVSVVFCHYLQDTIVHYDHEGKQKIIHYEIVKE